MEPSKKIADRRIQFKTGRVVTIATTHALHDTYTAFLAPLLPKFINTLSLSKTEAGLLTVFMQVPSLLQPLIGHIADQINILSIVALTPTITAAMMCFAQLWQGKVVVYKVASRVSTEFLAQKSSASISA